MTKKSFVLNYSRCYEQKAEVFPTCCTTMMSSCAFREKVTPTQTSVLLVALTCSCRLQNGNPEKPCWTFEAHTLQPCTIVSVCSFCSVLFSKLALILQETDRFPSGAVINVEVFGFTKSSGDVKKHGSRDQSASKQLHACAAAWGRMQPACKQSVHWAAEWGFCSVQSGSWQLVLFFKQLATKFEV